VYEARLIRDAEQKNPGIIKRTLEQKFAAGKEPTRADVKRVRSAPPEISRTTTPTSW
jgi:hypothetical protein